MTEQTGPTIVYVSYQGTPETHFDREYYVTQHIPLLTRSWQPHGLESAAAFFRAVDEPGTIAICELRFRDADALTAAMAAPETQAVMADVAQFTAIKPMRVRAAAM
ncbi:EthD family reductase [Sphingomonas abietis]|uniref:EthD family reductase n=1 Tax=Sphingomonas abietis TaxID=3012344 RepID=A0ABY7NQ92_9SPHN|nr:EthD family reductase [Sphingomonas abietis]WBO23711.1 EthD family reductase [Sphingomonas abietis]